MSNFSKRKRMLIVLFVCAIGYWSFFPHTPMEDPRIIQEEYSEIKSQEIKNKFYSATGEIKSCLEGFTQDYHDKVMEHCFQAGYANSIAGGCKHVVRFTVNFTVMKHALQNCNNSH